MIRHQASSASVPLAWVACISFPRVPQTPSDTSLDCSRDSENSDQPSANSSFQTHLSDIFLLLPRPFSKTTGTCQAQSEKELVPLEPPLTNGGRSWQWVNAPLSCKESFKRKILGGFLLMCVSGGPHGVAFPVPIAEILY